MNTPNHPTCTFRTQTSPELASHGKGGGVAETPCLPCRLPSPSSIHRRDQTDWIKLPAGRIPRGGGVGGRERTHLSAGPVASGRFLLVLSPLLRAQAVPSRLLPLVSCSFRRPPPSNCSRKLCRTCSAGGRKNDRDTKKKTSRRSRGEEAREVDWGREKASTPPLV